MGHKNKLELKNATMAPKMIFALHKTDPPHSQYRSGPPFPNDVMTVPVCYILDEDHEMRSERNQRDYRLVQEYLKSQS